MVYEIPVETSIFFRRLMGEISLIFINSQVAVLLGSVGLLLDNLIQSLLIIVMGCNSLL